LVARLKEQTDALQKEGLEEGGGTILSDGWTDVNAVHLINLLLTTRKGTTFDGTMELGSDDHQNAPAVAKVMIECVVTLFFFCTFVVGGTPGSLRTYFYFLALPPNKTSYIYSIGAHNIIQVNTDTCAVMKAAWKLVEAEFPWVTCGGCMGHVIALLIKDLSKIPRIAKNIRKTKRIVDRFHGRKPGPRARLKETVMRNHDGKKLALYRPAATRFAGHVRMEGRACRLRGDVKEIVVSEWYEKEGFDTADTKEFREASAERKTELDGVATVSEIVLDKECVTFSTCIFNFKLQK
jgi:hypothetical protein